MAAVLKSQSRRKAAPYPYQEQPAAAYQEQSAVAYQEQSAVACQRQVETRTADSQMSAVQRAAASFQAGEAGSSPELAVSLRSRLAASVRAVGQLAVGCTAEEHRSRPQAAEPSELTSHAASEAAQGKPAYHQTSHAASEAAEGKPASHHSAGTPLVGRPVVIVPAGQHLPAAAAQAERPEPA